MSIGYSVNKVITEPFPDNSVKTELFGEGEFRAAKMTNTKKALVRLRVMEDCQWVLNGLALSFEAGSHVWVRASDYSAPWGKEIVTVGDRLCIFLPCERIEIVEEA